MTMIENSYSHDCYDNEQIAAIAIEVETSFQSPFECRSAGTSTEMGVQIDTSGALSVQCPWRSFRQHYDVADVTCHLLIYPELLESDYGGVGTRMNHDDIDFDNYNDGKHDHDSHFHDDDHDMLLIQDTISLPINGVSELLISIPISNVTVPQRYWIHFISCETSITRNHDDILDIDSGVNLLDAVILALDIADSDFIVLSSNHHQLQNQRKANNTNKNEIQLEFQIDASTSHDALFSFVSNGYSESDSNDHSFSSTAQVKNYNQVHLVNHRDLPPKSKEQLVNSPKYQQCPSQLYSKHQQHNSNLAVSSINITPFVITLIFMIICFFDLYVNTIQRRYYNPKAKSPLHLCILKILDIWIQTESHCHNFCFECWQNLRQQSLLCASYFNGIAVRCGCFSFIGRISNYFASIQTEFKSLWKFMISGLRECNASFCLNHIISMLCRSFYLVIECVTKYKSFHYVQTVFCANTNQCKKWFQLGFKQLQNIMLVWKMDKQTKELPLVAPTVAIMIDSCESLDHPGGNHSLFPQNLTFLKDTMMSLQDEPEQTELDSGKDKPVSACCRNNEHHHCEGTCHDNIVMISEKSLVNGSDSSGMSQYHQSFDMPDVEALQRCNKMDELTKVSDTKSIPQHEVCNMKDCALLAFQSEDSKISNSVSHHELTGDMDSNSSDSSQRDIQNESTLIDLDSTESNNNDDVCFDESIVCSRWMETVKSCNTTKENVLKSDCESHLEDKRLPSKEEAISRSGISIKDPGIVWKEETKDISRKSNHNKLEFSQSSNSELTKKLKERLLLNDVHDEKENMMNVIGLTHTNSSHQLSNRPLSPCSRLHKEWFEKKLTRNKRDGASNNVKPTNTTVKKVAVNERFSSLMAKWSQPANQTNANPNPVTKVHSNKRLTKGLSPSKCTRKEGDHFFCKGKTDPPLSFLNDLLE